LEAPVPDDYSSGESDKVQTFHIKMKDLPPNEYKRRMLYLWEIVYKKAKGAAVVKRK